MNHALARSSRTRLTNHRGAALLLAVYFASLMLLVLSGVSLQRTMLETRSAQLSRDNTQAFYLADGVLDQALRRLKTERLEDGRVYPGTSSLGTASFRVLKDIAAVTSPERQRIVRHIEATGTQRQGKAAVLGSFVEEGPLAGAWSNSYIVVMGDGPSSPKTTLTADLYSNLGVSGAIRLLGDFHFIGSANVGLPAPTDEAFELPGFEVYQEAYRNLLGDAADTDGIAALAQEYTATGTTTVSGKTALYGNGILDMDCIAHGCGVTTTSHVTIPAPTMTGSVASLASVGQIPPIELPAHLAGHCASPLVLSEFYAGSPAYTGHAFTYHISGVTPPWLSHVSSPYRLDNFWGLSALIDAPAGTAGVSTVGWHAILPPGSVPTDPIPADGRNELCIQAADINGSGGGYGADLVFSGPTTLYVTGSMSPPGSDDHVAFRLTGGGHLVALDEVGRLIPDGVHLVVTKVDEARAGDVVLQTGVFSGSIYAPQSKVDIAVLGPWARCAGANCGDDAPVGSIVGREVVLRFSRSLDIAGSITQTGVVPAASDAPALVSWRTPKPQPGMPVVDAQYFEAVP